ncbi:TPA: trypsin-like peptidase domain-containing protein [Morganella morganii]|nr:trypsin-like peptidase domain-containing protein [Morganella morganii]HDF2423045.1 trypsin-like peptidase domain-containing protein [Morganella morganii]
MTAKYGDRVEYMTTRITTDNGSVGAGFFFLFNGLNENEHIPVLVTNKHVIRGADSIRFLISVENEETKDIISKFAIDISQVQSQFFFHPDEEVDLCVLPIGNIHNKLGERNLIPNICPFSEEVVFTNESTLLGNVSPIQEIHMTGYPRGLWDDVNNKPITRKGITASNVKQNWQGKKKFLADIACFPGSSGSPVYIYDDGIYMDGDRATIGERIVLLGILYAGPTVTAEGEIRAIEIPTDYKHMAYTELMMNLGYIIKAEELFVIKEIMIKIIQSQV